MKLWFRMLYYFIATWFRAKIENLTDTSKLTFRVWPTDLDISFHMNNGRYLTIMDFGRLDLMVRTPLWRQGLKNKWTPVVSNTIVRFRRELRCFDPFVLETRIVDWSDIDAVFEHRILFTKGPRKDQVAAYALVRAGLYDRAKKAYVPVETLMSLTNTYPPEKPNLEEVKKFSLAEEMLFSSSRVKEK